MNPIIEKIRKTVPTSFERQEVDKLLAGVISRKTLENLAVKGTGPRYYLLRGRVIYDREEFLTWLSKRMCPKKKQLEY